MVLAEPGAPLRGVLGVDPVAVVSFHAPRVCPRACPGKVFPTDTTEKQRLELVETRTYANGVQLQVLGAVR